VLLCPEALYEKWHGSIGEIHTFYFPGTITKFSEWHYIFYYELGSIRGRNTEAK
jgi:hypothetical protein